jgi:YD repeat-containing protein
MSLPLCGVIRVFHTFPQPGNVLTRTDHVGTWTYTYNSFGEVLTAKDPLGNTTTNTYDANGNDLPPQSAHGIISNRLTAQFCPCRWGEKQRAGNPFPSCPPSRNTRSWGQ